MSGCCIRFEERDLRDRREETISQGEVDGRLVACHLYAGAVAAEA